MPTAGLYRTFPSKSGQKYIPQKRSKTIGKQSISSPANKIHAPESNMVDEKCSKPLGKQAKRAIQHNKGNGGDDGQPRWAQAVPEGNLVKTSGKRWFPMGAPWVAPWATGPPARTNMVDGKTLQTQWETMVSYTRRCHTHDEHHCTVA